MALTLRQAVKAMTDEAVRRASPADIHAMRKAVFEQGPELERRMREGRFDPMFRRDPAGWYLRICRAVAAGTE